MKTNPGWLQAHKPFSIFALAICVVVGSFFLAPVVHVITACANNWESPGYYLFKVGLRIYVGPTICVQ